MFNILNNKGALKKHLSLFLIFGVIISIGIIAYSIALPSDQYTINGNSVEWENSAGKIVVTPHTIQGVSGCQVINVTNKLGSSKNVDILFRLKDDSNIKPKSAELYQPHTIQIENSLVCNSANYGLIDSSTAWCNETVLIDANGTWLKTGTYWTHAYDRYITSANSATLFWNTTENSNWLDVSKTVTKQSHSTGMLYYWTNVNFDASEEKSLRICMDTLPTLNTPTEKFDVCLKYTEDTFDTALDTGRYVCIDPWFDSSHNYKRQINTTHSSSGVLNNFTYLANGTNGFTFGSGTNQIVWVKDSINSTDYIYYTDDFNYTFTNGSENANLCAWVEYGNTTKKQSCTWSEMNNRYGFEEGSGTNVGNNANGNKNLTVDNAIWETNTSNCKFGTCLDTSNYSAVTTTNKMIPSNEATVLFWFNAKTWDTSSGLFCQIPPAQGNDYVSVYLTAAGLEAGVAGGGGTYCSGTVTGLARTNHWYHFAWSVNSTSSWLYIDGVLNKTDFVGCGGTFDSIDALTYLGKNCYYESNQLFNGYIDEVKGWTRMLSPEEVKREYNQELSVLGTTASQFSETYARAQIVSSITNSLPLAKIYTDQQIYVRYLNGTQKLGTFDKVAVYGNQRWAFNFVDVPNEAYTNMDSLSPSLFVWENDSITLSQIDTQITALINSTLAS